MACLHQVVGDDGTATGFAGWLLGRLARRRQVLWCLRRDAAAGLHLPGLAALGLAPDRLIVVAGGDDKQVLWAMEEGLRCPALGGVLGEVTGLDLTAGRRLQLAAEAGGVTALCLHPSGTRAAGAATTRWRVSAAPGGLWRVALERCRGGEPRQWLVERMDATGDLAVAAEFRDGSADAA